MTISYFEAASWATAGTTSGANAFKDVTVTCAVGDVLVAFGFAENTTGTGGTIATQSGTTSAWTLSTPTGTSNSNVAAVGGWATVSVAGSITVRVTAKTFVPGTDHMGAAVFLIPAAEVGSTYGWVTTLASDTDGQASITMSASSTVIFGAADWTASSIASNTGTPASATNDKRLVDGTQYSVWIAHWITQASGTTSYGPSGLSAVKFSGSIFRMDTAGAGALTATAALTGAGSIAATTRTDAAGSVSLAGTRTVTVTGVVGESATATLSGTGSIVASGVVAASATATLNGVGAATATTRMDAAGTATVNGVGTITVAGVIGTFAAATLNGTGTITATGTSVSGFTATLNGAGTITSSGVVGTSGQVLVTGAGSIITAGAVGKFTTATLNGAGSIVVTGLAGTFILTVTPPSRTERVPADPLRLAVPPDVRVLGIPVDVRVSPVPVDPRTLTVPSDPRVIQITE